MQFSSTKAYFHLHALRSDGLGDEEIIAIHCDIDIASSDLAFKDKRGPHLHVFGSKRDIHKSHIALCLSDLERTCSDFNSFSSAFAGIVKMIGDEIFPRL